MLTKKKKIIVLQIAKLKLYYFIKNKIKLILFVCCATKYKVFSKALKYFYNLKLNSVVSYVIEANINYFIEFLFSFNTFFLFNKLKNFSKSKSLYSVIRSPFVYKKSMEQYSCKKHKLNYKTSLFSYDFLLAKYQYFLIKKELNQNSIFKYFFKITFFFNNNETTKIL
jgi:hypothetical protein